MDTLQERLIQEIGKLKETRTYRYVPSLEGEQGAHVRMDGREILMLSSNNYLGLASHPRIKEAARRGIEEYGCGTASVRFICGTLDAHLRLERQLADFLGYEAALAYTSCWNANEGLIPALMGAGDTIFSDELNHASIIDGIRLSKAGRKIYAHRDMQALERLLQETAGSGLRMIITDGVFSMEGDFAPLPEIVTLARTYGAFVAVDDSHATGFIGRNGRGTPEYFGVEGRVDILTSTLGKALGGASGGFVCGPKDLIDFLGQRSRLYIFSNALPPAIVYASMEAVKIITESSELQDRLIENTRYFRERIVNPGFEVVPGEHPIVPVIVRETPLALQMSQALFEEGIFVSGFGYPVVPENKARLRVQISAAHTKEDLDFALAAFEKIGKRLGITR